MNWRGRDIDARTRDLRPPRRGRVLTDLGNAAHTAGRMYVQFHDGGRHWVDACVCQLVENKTGGTT